MTDMDVVANFHYAQEEAAALGFKIEATSGYFMIRDGTTNDELLEDGLESLEAVRLWLQGYRYANSHGGPIR